MATGHFLAAAVHAQQPQKMQKATKAAKRVAKSAPVELIRQARAIEILKAASERLAAARSMNFTAVVTYEFPRQLDPAQ